VENFLKGCAIDLQVGKFSRITIDSESTAGFDWSWTPAFLNPTRTVEALLLIGLNGMDLFLSLAQTVRNESVLAC